MPVRRTKITRKHNRGTDDLTWDRVELLFTGIVMFGTSFAGLAGPYIQKHIIDTPLVSGDITQLHWFALGFLGAAVIQVASQMGYNYLLNRSAWEILRLMRLQIFRHLQSL